jgi:hypothetical protein
MDAVQISKGIRTIPITNEDGEITAKLRVNTADASIIGRYYDAIDRLSGMDAEMSAGKAEIDKQNLSKEEWTIKMSTLRVGIIKSVINELNSIFGVSAIETVFSDCIAINPDFIPEEYQLLEFLNNITPIMQELFKAHNQSMKKKYGVK